MTGIKIQLQLHNWFTNNEVYSRGYCFDQKNQFYEGKELLNIFCDIDNEEQFQSRLTEINGIFSVIIKKKNKLFAASDKTHVYPLFYFSNIHSFTISDSPYQLLDDAPKIDKEAAKEFLLSSYTLDEKTLIKDIFQIKPSCSLYFNGKISIQKKYFSYCSKESELFFFEEQILEQKFRGILENIFRRLIISAKGRQIVVPLSGGYDSRLIVTMLRELGYKNVICYTVGRENNPEYEIAKEVTKELGYPHYFIFTGNKELIQNYTFDQTFLSYYKFSGALCQTFWMYEYFGLKYLIDNNIVSSDALFVPGHTGDFLAGSKISAYDINADDSSSKIINKISKLFFIYGIPNKHNINKISKIIEDYEDCTNYSKFENSIFSIRLPKLINNSARIYDFFGYDVRLPFWDNEIIEFFRRLPLPLKRDKRFYTNYLKNNLFNIYQVNFDKELQSLPKRNKVLQFVKLIKIFIPKFFLKFVVKNKDITCMKEISSPLIQDLREKKIKLKTTQYNEVFCQWYFAKIKEDFKID